ncbi:MAG: hypothetical protein JWQ14_2003, partial [Adhaeribacter sp.]|nr:hypothetical protein [Adhaeribacter sp.]
QAIYFFTAKQPELFVKTYICGLIGWFGGGASL